MPPQDTAETLLWSVRPFDPGAQRELLTALPMLASQFSSATVSRPRNIRPRSFLVLVRVEVTARAELPPDLFLLVPYAASQASCPPRSYQCEAGVRKAAPPSHLRGSLIGALHGRFAGGSPAG
jgi:hypothetical protein